MNIMEALAAYNTRVCEINEALPKIDDETALMVKELFPMWGAGIAYEMGMRVRFDDKLYRCEQTHTSQAGWEPDKTPALYTEVAKPGEIPVWRQPTGAQDAYNTGDRVHYPDKDGPVYESLIDSNIWAPDVYGWREV